MESTSGHSRASPPGVSSSPKEAEAARPELLPVAIAPRLATAIVVLVLVSLCLIGAIHVFEQGLGLLPSALCVLYMLMLLALQLVFFTGRHRRAGPWWTGAALAAEACLAYLPILQFGDAWVGMPGFLAGSLPLALPPRVGWTGFVLVVTSMAAVQAAFSGRLDDILYTAVSTMLTGLVVFGLSRLAELVRAVHAARVELARAAVEEERTRVARDLHDLLGYSLSAIGLKAELSRRLLERQPAQARHELDEVLAIARRAQADVRAVARGGGELSLTDELRSARGTLDAAGVAVSVTEEGDLAEIPLRVRTLLAIVLREAATNVLRHSIARTCAISVWSRPREAGISVENDQVGEPDRAAATASGSGGLANLRDRVAEHGGEVTVVVEPPGTFRVRAVVPLRPRTSPGPHAVDPCRNGQP